MRRYLCLLTLTVAACSNTNQGAGEGLSTDSDEPTSSAAPSPDANSGIPAEQQQYFEDGVVTLAEYQEAFSSFAQCAADNGIADYLREAGRDEVTGVISYSTQTELLAPGRFDGTALNDCYQTWFVEVEAAFQTTDPAVLAATPQEQMVLFNDMFRPCLEHIGVDIPVDLEFNDENWGPLNDEASLALADGRCDSLGGE